jgi:hypothetical protein
MLQILAKWWAKKQYIWKQEVEAATNDIHVGLSLRLAGEKRALIEQLNKDADEIEANIKSVDEHLAAGYYECENCHETDKPFLNGTDSFSCPFPMADKLNGACAKPARFVSLATMSGQEKTQSDRERNEAQTIADNKRATAKAEEENVAGSEKTAKYFQDQAKNNRTIAEKIRSL